MNPQDNDIDFNDPKIQKAFAFFQQQQQQQQMQQQMQQMMFQQQQQQQQFMMQQFMMQQQWNEFLQFCQMSGLNSNDPNALKQFYQMKMNMNNINNVNNPMPMGNMNNPMGMNNINNNNQQQINKSTNLNQPTVYINSEVQPPRGDNVYLQDQLGNNNNGQTKETIPRMNKTLYVNENELKGNNAFNMNQNQNNFMKFGMSSSTDIVNVTLIATSGLKVVIPAQKSMPLCQLFKNYVKKVGVPESVIGTKIVFLFNAEKLDVNSTQPISDYFKSFNANITVLDQANIIGA